jgi:hypothetical protein
MYYSIKLPTGCTTNLLFIALSPRQRSTSFGHYCAHHQEPPPTALAASGYRMIAGLDVFQTVVGLLVRLQCVLAPPTHTVTSLVTFFKMHGTTNPIMKYFVNIFKVG